MRPQATGVRGPPAGAARARRWVPRTRSPIAQPDATGTGRGGRRFGPSQDHGSRPSAPWGGRCRGPPAARPRRTGIDRAGAPG